MAEHELRMPKLGMQMTEGTITDWLVTDGTTVVENQPVVTISTDKVDNDVQSPANGVIRILIALDETVEVGTVLAVIA